MSFHLQISMQRNSAGIPASGRSNARSAPSRVATVEIIGQLSEENRRELRQRVEALGAADAETIVIHLQEVSLDRPAATAFCDWIGALRRGAKPIHVAALQSDVHCLLAELAHQPEWLMPLAGSETGVNRKVVTTDGPCAATESGSP